MRILRMLLTCASVVTPLCYGADRAALKAADWSARDLEIALAGAKASWGVEIDGPVRIEFANLNNCQRLHHTPEIATIHVAETITTMRAEDDSEPPMVSKSYAYMIQVNASCKWNAASLLNVVTHEVGHVLLGAGYHSQNKRSIMFAIVDGDQKILPDDLARIIRVSKPTPEVSAAVPSGASGELVVSQ